jgi:hypothetical protein
LFEGAAEACRADSKSGERQLAERINELAVAKFLAEDKGLQSSITYEPELLPDGRKIDFVADRGRDNAYIEAKTVHPDIADTEAAWENYLKRSKLHPPNANFVVKKDWMGGKLYGNIFASRSRFLEYTLDFETRLAAAKKIRRGPGLLVFCGNGVPCQLRHPYATRSFVSTPLQDGQTNMSCSRRTPSFEIVRKCFMVSPQERHTMVGVLLGAGGERSLPALRACNTACATPLKQAGALPNSQPPTPGAGPLSVVKHM